MKSLSESTGALSNVNILGNPQVIEHSQHSTKIKTNTSPSAVMKNDDGTSADPFITLMNEIRSMTDD